ncbi:alpha/beta hydrolase [Rivibacter subsaxonicus]|uniref:TAP-like protein n=1 Tax=Rivibacter subsaxonicus TaxID=457575 RepID=A0A4Q7VW11_9BURK|nr:alpha/beta hydrolase [Rivibacter subsaxonicus]RZU00877.1 TAP-like protein [Rivibacter subsaxonicus]
MRNLLRRWAPVALLPLALSANATTSLSPTPCRIEGLRHEALCGSVKRALDPARAEGPQIELHYVVIPATARRKAPDPVFFLAGGPGQSAIALAPDLANLFSRLSNRRDLVFVDQRGTGRSAPLLCDSESERLPLARRIDLAEGIRRLEDCRARLQKLPHGDLRQYTTTIAMADLDAVRAALGAERINLVGGSYGTRAGLEYLRLFPQQVRRLVLDGVAPPDMALPLVMAEDAQAALDATLAACASDAACKARHPDLGQRFKARLDALPQSAVVTDPVNGVSSSLTMTREALLSALRGPLYAPALAAALPEALGAAASARYEPLFGLASVGQGSAATRLAEGQHFSVICAEDWPQVEGAAAKPAAAPPSMIGDAFLQPYRALCAQWPRGAVAPAFYTVAPSPVPVLLLSGGLDPVTPPRHGERMAKALGANARHVVVPAAGHGLMAQGCTRDLLHRFIDDESSAAALDLDASCIKRIPPPLPFIPPDPLSPAATTTGAAR